MEYVLFDFFKDTKEELLIKICNYFHLNKDDIFQYLESQDLDYLTVNKFVTDFNLDLNEFDSNQVKIACCHITTCTQENLIDFKNEGLLDLKSMLQPNTLLSNFLLEHGITINVDKKLFKYNYKNYKITTYYEECNECVIDPPHTCTKHSRCDFKEAMDSLGSKLYKFNATVEFFVYASIQQMKNYSSISRHPEILTTIDNIINKLDNANRSSVLGFEWHRNNPECYLIEFTATLSDMETYEPIDYNSAYSEIASTLEQSGYDEYQYLNHEIPKYIFDNRELIRWFIVSYTHIYKEQYSSLKAHKTIAPQELILTRI